MVKKKRKKPQLPTQDPTNEDYLLSTMKLLRAISGIVGLVLHLWTCWIAYEFDTILWTIVHFFLFIFAELYWSVKIYLLQGLNSYSVLAGSWAIIHIMLLTLSFFLHRKQSPSKRSNENFG